jgi:septin family protein
MNLSPTNQGIRDFLASYCRRESPKYAVMITGEWGAGKTWLVNEIMKQEGLEHFRISLFGISTRQEIYDEFFAQCHPMLASPGTRVVAGIARGILSRITFPIGSADMQSQTQLEQLGLKELLINVKDKIVILDDFERCRLPVRETLGIISSLLDEDSCKVIIISNDYEIQDTEYASYKEKVVAYTFKAEPEAELALDQFWNIMGSHRLNDKLVNEIKEIIGIVHDQSGYMNLRHLRVC